MAINKLILVTVLVRDPEASLKFFTEKLGFEKRQDLTQKTTGFRWLTVAPQNQKEIEMLLRKPYADANELITTEVEALVGKGALWTFSTSDCEETYNELKANGVNFINPPTKQSHGIEALFEDLDGNRFNILQIG